MYRNVIEETAEGCDAARPVVLAIVRVRELRWTMNQIGVVVVVTGSPFLNLGPRF